MILTALLITIAQTDQGLPDVELLRRLHTMHVEMAELGDLARAKSTNPAVKSFATTLANDHRRMDRIVVSIAGGMKAALETSPEVEATQRRDALRAMPADKSFDSAFLERVESVHNPMLNVMQTEKNRTSNGRLRDHLRELITLELKHRNKSLELAGKKANAAS